MDPSVGEDIVMDGLDTLQDACTLFYSGAQCSKLATIHGCPNKFVDELFSILHNFLLPTDNCLSSNMHGAKTLTLYIGLKYNQIHACKSICVLYRGKHANFITYQKCGKEKYKQVGWTTIPIKILQHFPLIA